MKSPLAPQSIISLGTLFLLSIIAAAVNLATTPPWLGLTLAPAVEGTATVVLAVDPTGPAAGRVGEGERLVALGERPLALMAADLMEEPDALAYYRDYNAFFVRQSQLHAALTQAQVALLLGDGRVEMITPQPQRPIATLPWIFWYQIACGAIVFLAGVSVLAFRPHEQVTSYYALTGLGLLLAAASAAVYSTRELALEGGLFHTLSLANQFGTLLFAGPFISILWYYPQRIHRFPLGSVVIAYYMVSWLLNYLQAFDSLDVAMRYPIFVGLLINLSLALIQWRRSRGQPVQRAILKWFLLAWLSGTTFYVGLHTIPLMLGGEVFISQSMAWGVLLTVYLGVALGITRYRLFNLDRWVIIGWLWFLGGITVIAMDAMLVSLLELDNHLALATTLALAGWIYFPLRQYLWRHFSWYSRRGMDYRQLLPELLTTLLNTRPGELSREWSQLLGRIYAPLNIELLDEAVVQVRIDPEGSSLTLPALQGVEARRLNYADRGSRLFNDEDRQLAESMHQLFGRIQLFRQAFNDGVHEERRRVARDLHDDVGARLLTLVYAASEEKQADLARETLQELRDVISNLEKTHYTLDGTLDELHRETVRRCESHHVSLLWHQPTSVAPHSLESRAHSNLQRIVREAVSNALRHSEADQLQIEIEQEKTGLTIRISDNDTASREYSEHKPGRGLRNIRLRAQELGGAAAWHLGHAARLGGTTVEIVVPIGEREDG